MLNFDKFDSYNYNWKSYIQSLGKTNAKMVCIESGIVPGLGMWGFGNESTAWADIEGGISKLQDNSYLYTEDNLYFCETGGTIDSTQKPTHTSGTAIYGEVELLWVDKIAKVRVDLID